VSEFEQGSIVDLEVAGTTLVERVRRVMRRRSWWWWRRSEMVGFRFGIWESVLERVRE